MSIPKPPARWALPLAAAVLLAGAPFVVSTAASAEPPLPARSAQELLVDLQGLAPRPVSGEVRQVVDLGLPQLPGFASPSLKNLSAGSLLTLASGTHTWRLWSDGATKSRVDLLQPTGESDLIRNGSDLWVWSSADSSAVHSTLPAASGRAADPADAGRTPAEVADQVLQALDPTTEVTTDRGVRVAGRAAYELVLTPKQAATKVGSVRLALDAETKVPLRVEVIAKGGADAIDVGFTSVSFDAPDASVFAFAPPAGTTVTEQPVTAPSTGTPRPTVPAPDAAKPAVVGTGWATVVVAASPLSGAGAAAADRTTAALLDQLPKVSGSWGSGRLLDGTIVSVVVTDDGRVAAGAVAPDAVYAALS